MLEYGDAQVTRKMSDYVTSTDDYDQYRLLPAAQGTPSQGARGSDSVCLSTRVGGTPPQGGMNTDPSISRGIGLPSQRATESLSFSSDKGDGMPSSTQVCSQSVNKFTPISPTKYRSANEVIGLYSQYKNSKVIGRLAIALAKYTYFGNAVLSRSTITGRGNKAALDPSALRLLQGNIRAIFPNKDDDEFEDICI